MKKEKKFVKLYKEWLKKGRLPKAGLCMSINDDCDLSLFAPNYGTGYWGYWGEKYDMPVYTQDVDDETANKLMYTFNPLRQTIVLFLAAMNDEL